MAVTPNTFPYTPTATGAQTITYQKLNVLHTSTFIAVSGTYTGLQFTFQGTYDGTNFFPVFAINVSTGAGVTGATTITPGSDAEAAWVVPSANMSMIRMNVSALSSTGVTVTANDANIINPPYVVNQQGGESFAGLVTFTGGSLYPDNATAAFGDASDITMKWDATDFIVGQAAADSTVKWGVSGAGINHIFYGDTATRDASWDQTNDQFLFADNAKLAIGSGAGSAGDITFSWNATKMLVAQLTTNSAIDWGVDDDGIDQNWYGATASALMQWDQSADALIFTGAAGVKGFRAKQTTAVAITGATTLTLADSGGIFTVSQAAAYDIDLPSPTTGPGCTYVFSLTAAGANNVTITVAGSAATFVGTIVNDVTSVIVATGSTLTYATGASALGDTIIARSIATNLYHIQAVTSTAAGITVA